MDELYSAVANVGFPIVITLYLLIRIEGKLDNLGQCINSLSINIEKLEKWKQKTPNLKIKKGVNVLWLYFDYLKKL